MKKQPLHVSLHACEPSVVELTVGDRVRLDRLIRSPHGVLAERHGRLLGPGATTVALPPGRYTFKTLSDANLRVVTGGVSVSVTPHDKDGGPIELTAKGDQLPGPSPSLTVENATRHAGEVA